MRALRKRLAGQGGFTLIELLVAMATGLIVITTATALIVTGLNDTAQVTGREQAIQEGRTGLETLVQELNSGCLVSDISPVQPSTAAGITPAVASDGNHLVFVSGLGDSVNPTPTEHVISISGSHAFKDTSYAYNGATSALDTPADWTFSSTPEGAQMLLEYASAEQGTPLFQYFSYTNPANPTANSLDGATPLTQSRMPLSSDPSAVNAAASVAQVDINVVAEPTDTQEQAGGSADFDDSATFRLTTADPSSFGTNYPCD
jgi:prepilin-type N-terminal cleavage/methylation domain-containing protein